MGSFMHMNVAMGPPRVSDVQGLDILGVCTYGDRKR